MIPELYVGIAYQPFCPGDSFIIVTANHLGTPGKSAIVPDGICAIPESGPFGNPGLARAAVAD
jgi:hypothetical protein